MKIVSKVLAKVKTWISLLASWKEIQVVVLVGTGRTGTEFLASFFEKLYPSRALSLHEPEPDLLKISVSSRLLNWPQKRIVNAIKLARIKYLKTCKNSGRDYYIESNNNLSFLLPYLKLVFPKIKVIYVTRNCETFLKSEMNKRHGSNKFLLFSETDKRERITPMVLKSEERNQWSSWSRAQKIIWYWKACNEFVQKEIKSYDYIVVKYEDFFSKEKINSVLDEILAFIDLERNVEQAKVQAMLDERKNSSKHSEFTGLSELTDDEKKFYHAMVDNLHKDLKYESSLQH
jgi:hypothetical protein